MFIILKKDFNEKTQTAQIKLLGVFSRKEDAFGLADKHSAIGFNNDAGVDEEDTKQWSVSYTSRNHNYLIEVHNVNDDHFDEVEILNSKVNPGALGYAFTW